MLKHRIKKLPALMIAFAVGAILSLGKIFGFSAPFASVLPMILPLPFGIAAAIGAAFIGAVTMSFNAIPLFAAMIAALLSRVRQRGLILGHPHFSVSALSSGAYLMASMAILAFSGGGALDMLREMVFAALLLTSGCVFSKAAYCLRSAKRLPHAVSAFCLSWFVCALCSVGIGAVSLGGIVAACAVLYCSVRFGPAVSAAAAMLSALGAGLANPDDFAVFALLGIPAVICGLSSFGGPIGSAACLLAVISPIAIIFGGSDRSLALLCDCAAAAVIFVITYRPVSRMITALFPEEIRNKSTYGTEPLKSALNDISERLAEISENGGGTQRSISDAVYSKVCIGCNKNADCSQKTLSELDKLPMVGDAAELYRALPYCSRIPEVRRVSIETSRRSDYLTAKVSEQKNCTRLCFDMLYAIEDVIADAEKAALRSQKSDRHQSTALEKALKRSGVRFQSASVYPSGTAEIAFHVSARINEVKIAAAVSEISGTDYQRPERFMFGETVLLRLSPKPLYSAEIASCQLSAKADASGDVCESFVSGRYSYALISDGMGIGSEARAVSTMLVNLLKELICAGFSISAAISLCSLILRSAMPEESFATLDLLKIDLSNGAAELYKAGGCRSFLLDGGGLTQLRAGGYPIGILSPCDVKIHRFYIKDSAVLVMMTDGAQNLSPESFAGIANIERLPPSSELAALLMGRTEPEKMHKKDDISVTVVKINRKTV